MRGGLALGLLAAAGCNQLLGTSDFVGPSQAGDDGPDAEGTVPNCAIDLLFVIDDSGSMMEEQTNLVANLPGFVGLLADYRTPDGRSFDYRIAVATTGKDTTYRIVFPGFPDMQLTELGDDGAFRKACELERPWIERGDANGAEVLSCRGNVGTSGPSYEMPLLMTRWALAERVADGMNAGFVRDEALLAIVVISDADDVSTTQNNFVIDAQSNNNPPIDYDPGDLIAFLDQLKGRRSRWASTVIAGDGDCNSPFGAAENAARLKDLVVNAAPQAAFSSICDGDLTIGFARALQIYKNACSNGI